MIRIEPEVIRKRLLNPLPGQKSHRRMMVKGRSLICPDGDFVSSAILCALYNENGIWKTIFIKRPDRNPKDKHRGQIGFPGGKREATDDSLKDTALREANEEVGILPEQVDILGKLSDLYISVSNFMISPWVGYLNEKPRLIPQKNEVERIIETNIDDILNLNNATHLDMNIMNTFIRDIPGYSINGDFIWGATAMILSEFTDILKEI
jgi:8-oxo-dGTP pyrophosphatase MutT (NUDIX family)